MSLTAPEAQPTPGQDPQATPEPAAVAAPPAPPAAPAGNGPWAQDLEALFTDPTTRASVDSFLREKVQPYTTRLEQQGAVNEKAVNLWTQLEQSPIDTYVQLTSELLGEAAAEAALASVQAALESQQPPAPAAAPPQPGAPAQQYDERMQNLMNWAEAQQAQQYYSDELARVTSAHPDLAAEIGDTIHPFVAASGGDFDQAVTMYREFKTKFGTPQAGPPVPPAPPQVIGSDAETAQTSAAPVEPRKQTLDEAINDFMTESRAARQAPPVGAV